MKYSVFFASVLSLLFVVPAQAQIYELGFVDTNNATVVKSPSMTWYNPSGTITVTHIAGLDRKVKLELLKAGVVVSTQTSALLTVANRITASDGQAFYGVKFTMPAPAEGNYVLRSTVYDISGAQVSSNSYTFNVDVTKPTTGSFSWAFNYGGSSPESGVPMFSPVEAKAFALSQVTDSNSGVASVSYVANFLSGSYAGRTYTSGPVPYTAATGTAMLGNGGMYSGAQVISPDGYQGRMHIDFNVTDSAGNKTTAGMDYLNNGSCNSWPTMVAIADSSYTGSVTFGGVTKTGFRPVSSSATITAAPVQAIFRVPLTEYKGLPDGAYYGGYVVGVANEGLMAKDDKYAYFTVTGSYATDGYLNWSESGWTNGSTYRCAPFSAPSPQFGADVYPPVIQSVNAYIQGVGWVGGGFRGDISQPKNLVMTQVVYSVAARNYIQHIDGMLSGCDVSAGATSCTATGSWNINADNTVGCNNFGSRAYKKDNSAVRSGVAYNLFKWDSQAPTVGSLLTNDVASKTVTFTGTEPNSGACWNDLHMAGGGLKAKQNGTVVATMSGTIIAGSGNDSTIRASYGSLPDGNYDIYAYVSDAYGNTAELKLFSTVVDNTAPSISFTYAGAAVPANISKITDLRAILTDTVDTAPVVTGMTLSGGPLNDALQLGFSKQANGWAPEVPRMFPSLESGQEYTLTVTASDAQGNKSSKQIKFSLTPSNLVTLAGQTTFAVAQNLQDAAGKPLAVVAFKGALTDGQSQSRGNQSGYITLRSDSNFAVIFNGLTVNPGETKDVVIPLDSTGQVSLPIYPAASGVQGKASYMIDIPQLTVN